MIGELPQPAARRFGGLALGSISASPWHLAAALLLLLAAICARGADAPGADGLTLLNSGDTVSMEVYGQPDLTTTLYVGDDGVIKVPLAGPVPVAGISAVQAAARIERALKDGDYLRNPHVTLMIVRSSSQQVSVLGEVHTPGQYVVTPNTTVLDLIARAGGVTENSADTIYILHPDGQGNVTRLPVSIGQLSGRGDAAPTQGLHGGDSLLVPKAEQFYIYGEVAKPDRYRLQPGMTVIEAVTLAGGVTARGSDRRVDIKRMGKNGRYVTLHARASDPLQAGDVLRVKESLF